MAGIAALSKILDLREREKKDAQIAYYQSVDAFEEIATQLLELLRKKENAEEIYEKSIQTNMHVSDLKDQLTYIESLNDKILILQEKVQQARTKMEFRQTKLSEAHVETKKFEKIIELRTNEKLMEMKKEEEKFMDEISMQQFLRT